MYKFFSFKRLFLVVLFLSLISINLFAFQLTPNEVYYDDSGSKSVQTYTINNNSNESIAVEITAYKRYLDINGKEPEKLKESRYFSIMPRKVIVRPNSNQVVRVQYRGPRKLRNEGTYRIVFAQRAYEKGKNEQGKGIFTFLYSYSTVAYINPIKSTVDVKVSQNAKVVNGKAELTVINKGTVHQHLTKLRIELSDDGNNFYKLKNEELSDLSAINLLGNTKINRSVDLPKELKDNKGNLKVKYYFEI